MIRKLIIGNQHREEIAALIRAHNIDILCNTTREYLTGQMLKELSKSEHTRGRQSGDGECSIGRSSEPGKR